MKKSYKRIYFFRLAAISVFLAGACLWAEDKPNAPLRNRVYALHNITTAQGQAYLEKLKLATTISQIPQSNALVVTALPTDLVKVTTLLEMVDSKQVFVIDRLGPADTNLPKPAAITAQLKNVSVGTFTDPPSHAKKTPVILDVLNGTTVLISPEEISDTVIKAINEVKAAKTQKETAPAEPNNPFKTRTPDEEANKVAIPSAPAESNEDEMLNKTVNQLLSKKEPNQPQEPAAAVKQQEAPPTATVPADNQEVTPAAPAESEMISVEPNFIPNGKEELQLQLPETVDVVALLDLMRKYLNVNYMYDPTKINGTVTLKVQGKIKVSELYALVESVLKFKGFAMSRRGNLVTIVPSADALTIDPMIKTDSEQIQPGDMVVTAVYNLKYVNVASATALLANMKLGTSVNSVVETNTLIVTDFAYRMDRIDKLLALVDQPGAPKQFKFRQLKYTLASTLVPKIQAVAQQIGSESLNVQVGAATSTAGRSRGGFTRPITPSMPTPQTRPGQPGAAQGGQQPTIYLDYDERTNRLLMVGQQKEIALIEELVDAFDVPQQDLRSIKEYEIQYVDAREVTDTLTTLGIISGISGGSQQTRGSRIPSPQVQQQQQQQPGQPGAAAGSETSAIEEPQIAILESTNSLLVNATPEQQASVVMVISYVDRQPAEVAIPYMVYPLEFQKPSELKTSLSELIEKTIKDKEGKVQQTVSRGEDITIVSDDKAFSLIVYANRKNQDWVGSLIRQLDKKRPQVLIDVTLVNITRDDKFQQDLQMAGNFRTIDSNNTTVPLISPAAVGKNRAEWNTSTGQFFYSDQHIQALLTAVQSKSYGRVLAKPKILVNDNENGKITTDTTTYVQNQTTQVPTTGSAITSTTYQPYDAKIELDIKPHISEGDLLLLEVKMTREDFVETAQSQRLLNPSPPNKVASTVDSKVLVPDGSTIILGGMITLNQNKGGSKVPILGDIPIVGALFRSENNTDTESKLYIFVKAYALRPVEGVRGLPQAEAISRENRDAFERGEKKFQEIESIPGIKPKPMDPNKVLDEL